MRLMHHDTTQQRDAHRENSIGGYFSNQSGRAGRGRGKGREGCWLGCGSLFPSFLIVSIASQNFDPHICSIFVAGGRVSGVE